jgi:alpha-glucosidase
MPWQADAPHAGFTTADKPWLPVPDDHYQRSVNLQNRDPNSLLNTWRRLLHWRKKQPALEAGSLELLETEEPIFAFIREYAEQRILCIFNLSNKSASYDLSDYPGCKETAGLGFTTDRQGDTVKIPGYSVFFCDMPPTCDCQLQSN